MLIKEINQNFLLPIEFDKQKHEIFENLYTDLELLKQSNSKKTIYEKTFQPSSKMGHELLEKWCKYYTTNTAFLKDSQKLYNNIGKSKLLSNNSLVETCWQDWTKIKSMDNFIETFQYIEWEKLEFLNKSEMFLGILTFYQTISPLLSLMAPFILLLVPFGGPPLSELYTIIVFSYILTFFKLLTILFIASSTTANVAAPVFRIARLVHVFVVIGVSYWPHVSFSGEI